MFRLKKIFSAFLVAATVALFAAILAGTIYLMCNPNAPVA